MEPHTYGFTAIRGIQAGKEFYVAMCPLKLIPKIFLFAEGELPAELRAQRTLNRSRIPDIARYLVDNPTEYVFSSLTASIDGEVLFEPIDPAYHDIGRLTIPMTAQFLINDGQHRRAAIEEALRERPELGDESISVVLFIDAGLKHSQQMFADLNKHAVRPTKSLGVLYDHRDPLAQLSRALIDAVPVFKGLTETEKTSISNRSIKLFTLSSLYQATQALLRKTGKQMEITSREKQRAIDFWSTVSELIPEWKLAAERKANSSDLRKDYIHAHGLALQALGCIGADLMAAEPRTWKKTIKKISTIDWLRSNAKLWEGRATIGGRVSKAHNNVILTINVLKHILDLPLSSEEERVERLFNQGKL